LVDAWSRLDSASHSVARACAARRCRVAPTPMATDAAISAPMIAIGIPVL